MLALLEADAAPAKAHLRSAGRRHGHRLAAFLKSVADAFERTAAHHHDVEPGFAVAIFGMHGKPRLRCPPKSPHLQVWRWHITMATSILHRATGALRADWSEETT